MRYAELRSRVSMDSGITRSCQPTSFGYSSSVCGKPLRCASGGTNLAEMSAPVRRGESLSMRRGKGRMALPCGDPEVVLLGESSRDWLGIFSVTAVSCTEHGPKPDCPFARL